MVAAASPVRRRITISGIVQGVGFRPHVHQRAAEHGLGGFVVNTAAGVVIEVEGPPANVAAFVAAVVDRAPPLAVIDDVAAADVACTGASTFEIRASEAGAAATLVSPDVANVRGLPARAGRSG